MLSRIPSHLKSLNNGLSTLQFQSLSVSPHNVKILQGGTQDNGTWEWQELPGGVEEHDDRRRRPVRLRRRNPMFRFHNFTGASPDVNFDNGDFETGSGRATRCRHGGEFYAPVIRDPVVSEDHVRRHDRTAYRTKTAGLGTRTIAEAHAVCNEWTGDFSAAVR